MGWFIAGGLVVGAASPAVAVTVEELEQRLGALQTSYEQRIGELEQELERLKQQQHAVVPASGEAPSGWSADYVGRYEGPFERGGLVLENPSGFGNVSLGGYIDHEFEDFDKTDSTFDQHRWIINVGAELGDRIRFYSEYEIEHGGPSASGGEAKVEQAYVDYLIADWVNVRGGALLVPFGRYNIYHDSDLQDLTDRPLVARRVIPTTWTEAGAGFFGEANPRLGDYEDLFIGYEAYLINGLEESDISDRGLRDAKGAIGSDNNNNKSAVGRLLISPVPGHEIGFSGYTGNFADSGDTGIIGGAIDWLSTWGPLEIVGEYAYFDVEETVGSVAVGADDVPDSIQGYYVQANYHFWPEFLNNTFLGRSFDDPTFTLVGRYGWASIGDDGDAGVNDNEEDRFTLGFNYRPVESWVMKLEYQWNETENETLERGDNDGFMASVAMGF